MRLTLHPSIIAQDSTKMITTIKLKKWHAIDKIIIAIAILLTATAQANEFTQIVDRAVSTYYQMGEANVAISMSGQYYCEETVAFAMFSDMQLSVNGLPSKGNQDADRCIKNGHVKTKYVYAFLGYYIVYKEPGWIK